MAARKRSSNLQQGDEEESLTHSHRRKLSRRGGGGVNHSTNSRRPVLLQSPLQQQQENNSNEQQEMEDQPFLSGDRESDEKNPQEEDSDGSGTDPEDFDEVVTILRSELRNNVQCPICLGILRKTRTVMGCLHRFCQECIDKSMRLGNNECPACRMHCASRRSLRDDVAYDRLIDAIYPDAKKYEEEELLFGEEDKTRKEQIRASISQVSRRQLEASNRSRRYGKDADDISPVRAHRSFRNLYSRRRRSVVQRTDVEGIEENGMENDGDGNESPNNKEDGAETKQKRRRKRGIVVFSPSTTSPTMEETSEDESTPPPVPVYNAEMFTWGRCGARSNPQNGTAINNSRAIRGNRVSKLIDHLRSASKPKTESAVRFALVSFENEKTPNLRKPFLCCQPNLSINQLREHVAHEIRSLADEIEMLLVKNTGRGSLKTSVNSLDINWSDATLQILEGEDTLARISCSSLDEHLIIAYRLKKDNSPIHLSPA